MRRAIQVRAEIHSVFGDLAQAAEAEDLESARVGEQGPLPAHEPVQSAQIADDLVTGTQIKMVSISQNNLRAQFLQCVLRNAFHRTQSAHRHEYRGLDHAMGRSKLPQPRSASLGLNGEWERHRE